jgi:hypothetical protein
LSGLTIDLLGTKFAMRALSNRDLADRLNEFADILQQQQANRFRIAAYRRGATTLADMKEPAAKIYQDGGVKALIALPGIGKGIASSIVELLRTGQCTRLERLRGALDPSQLFQTVPGIGPKLAQLIHDELGIDTLEELEAAAHDGRLESVQGISHGRVQIIRGALAGMLARPRAIFHRDSAHGPGVGLLLAVDREYREKASRGELASITPKRFNPQGKAWLPVMHTSSEGWHFTALFSNTARAHQLQRTRDWVVIYYYNDDHEEGQHTVVSEISGPLKGKRVVRGREPECHLYYERPAIRAGTK